MRRATSTPDPTKIAAPLLKWYKAHGRDHLPWRQHEGRAETPYHTWLAEIMLQQTVVAAVIPYYERFTRRWPTVKKLAAALDEEVMQEWAGLGYYSRARNLLKCARTIVADHGGRFPHDVTTLLTLPGIGPYTANAIAAIAFDDKQANVVDGNVERVIARLFAYQYPINTPQGKKDLTALAAQCIPRKENGHYAQSLMDLGATICIPQKPRCAQCPLQSHCKAFANGQTENLPVKTRKKASPIRHGVSYVLRDARGHYLLQQNPAKGLLGGLWTFPETAWRDKEWTTTEIKKALPVAAPYDTIGQITHVFTHFKLLVTIVTVTVKTRSTVKRAGTWFAPDSLPAMSTLHKKILTAALSQE